ncbi:uncharacterized protein LOC122266583 [Penaeus japonicus]|uniref:uncharacterized protein LOC122266583 n=1 Tax=Penaeus japonicus TaxID=27405 RepID=UPI001C70C045|nr:uncharacterized protein LOC122266583 [Penaeus japonicus]
MKRTFPTHREGRAERRYLAMQVEQLRRKLDHLHNTCQVSRECKLGVGAEADLTAVEDKLAASLDLRWPGKIASQQARHIATMKQLQRLFGNSDPWNVTTQQSRPILQLIDNAVNAEPFFT